MNNNDSIKQNINDDNEVVTKGFLKKELKQELDRFFLRFIDFMKDYSTRAQVDIILNAKQESIKSDINLLKNDLAEVKDDINIKSSFYESTLKTHSVKITNLEAIA